VAAADLRAIVDDETCTGKERQEAANDLCQQSNARSGFVARATAR
jgi:hypothetical protein